MITSVGYAGSITDDNWRRMATATVGSLYGVDDYASWRVTAGPGDRQIKIAPGGAFGLGVRDVSDADITLTGAPVPSGERWDLVVAHRDWNTELTTPKIISGSSVKALPARDTGFGTTNDQPIALVRFAAGQTVVQQIIDLRCIPGDGGIVAFDDLARSYLDRVGTSLRIGGIVWDRIINSLDAPTWISSDMTDTGWVDVPRGAGWASVSLYPTLARRVGKQIILRGAVAVGEGNTGSVGSLCLVPAGLRPGSATFIGTTRSGLGSLVGELLIDSAGNVSLPPNYWSGALQGPGTVIPLHGTWFQD